MTEKHEKTLKKKSAIIQRLQRENDNLKKKMAAKESFVQDQSQIIDGFIEREKMYFHAMLEARLELTELRDNPQVTRQPALYKWMVTSETLQELGVPKRHCGVMTRSFPVEKTTNKDLSPDPIQGTEATFMTNPEPTESPDLCMTNSPLTDGKQSVAGEF